MVDGGSPRGLPPQSQGRRCLTSPALKFSLPDEGLALKVHLIDGTYELFRHYHALPSYRDTQGREVAAVRGVLASLLGMITAGATHLAVATDHVI